MLADCSMRHQISEIQLPDVEAQVAKNNEVMLAISNKNYAMPGGMLDTWMESVKRANVTNAMIVALDSETKKHAESMGIPAHFMTLQASINSSCLVEFYARA